MLLFSHKPLLCLCCQW